jgi:hypothetical protein
MLHGRWDAIWAFLKGLKDSLHISKQPFVNELYEETNINESGRKRLKT